jgi:hypothetical protein
MKNKTDNSEQERLVEEIEAKQRNTVWPDTIKNSSSVDAFLWKGSPDATLVQRIGAWIFGLAFMIAGLAILGITHKELTWPDVLVSLIAFLIGGKVFLNGFRRHRATRDKSK